jgi:hypothetical protein
VGAGFSVERVAVGIACRRQPSGRVVELVVAGAVDSESRSAALGRSAAEGAADYCLTIVKRSDCGAERLPATLVAVMTSV